MKLTGEERALLSKLSKEQLAFLAGIADDKEFSTLQDIVNYLMDHEKNVFFAEKEVDPAALAIDHAFARGGIAKLVMLLHIIGGSKHEIAKREEERKKNEKLAAEVKALKDKLSRSSGGQEEE